MSIIRLAISIALACSLTANLAVSAPAEMAHSSLPDAKAVIAKIVKAYGGREAVAGAKSVLATGDITAMMRKDKGSYTRLLEHDRKLRVETVYSRSSEVRILNGDDGWRGEGKGALEKVTGFRYLAMLYQYKQLDLPYGLMNNMYDVRVYGEGMVGDRHAYILSLKDREGPNMEAYVDSGNYRILKVVGYFDIKGNSASLSVIFDDFRKVDGLLVPFRVQNFSSGMPIGETVLKDCKVNPKMPGSLFRP